MFGSWGVISQTDPRAVALYQRHYSAKRGNRFHGIAGPGSVMTLLTPDSRALFVWRTERWLGDGDPPHSLIASGIACSVFRNEGDERSSDLIVEAVALARTRWADAPGFYTWVDPASIASPNPGYCFQAAGWQRTRIVSRAGLRLLVLPS